MVFFNRQTKHVVQIRQGDYPALERDGRPLFPPVGVAVQQVFNDRGVLQQPAGVEVVGAVGQLDERVVKHRLGVAVR